MLKNTKQLLTFKQGRGIAASWHVCAVLTLLLALLPLVTGHQTRNANAQTTTEAPPMVTDGGTLATTPLPAGTPAAGTPVPVGTAVASDPAVAPADTTIVADGADDQPGEPGRDGQDGRDGRDGADGQPGEPGQDGQDGQAGADAAASDSDRASDKDGKDREKKEKDRDRDRARGADGRDENGNGGVADVVANPPRYDQQLDLEQQDGTNSTAGATGENGTVNGVPREEPLTAPVTTTGPGAPLAPGEVNLPPAVPGLPDPAAAGAEVTSPNVDPAIAAGVTGTTELVFDAVSDTTVFTAAPDAPQTPESAGLLALGGPDGAATLVSFDVTGIGDGSVLAARLTFVGAGSSGAPGGGVGVIYDYIAPDGLTARKAPGSETAMSVQGTPAWFERVEPGALGAVDVTGSVFGDGSVTFVFTGQPEETALIQAMESGAPPQLILTVALPA